MVTSSPSCQLSIAFYVTRDLFHILLLVAVCSTCYSQEDLLMLQKRNRHKNAYYKVGDEISFRVKGSKSRMTSQIVGFRDSTILFSDYEVDLNQISSIYIDDKTKWWLRYKIEQLFFLAGSAYLLVDILNNKQLSKETAIIGGTSIGIGLLARLIIGNRIKLKGRTRLRIIIF